VLALIATLFVDDAHALLIVSCDPSRVTGTLPVANSSDVPVDAALVFLMGGDCGSPWRLEVIGAEDPYTVYASGRIQPTSVVGVLVPDDVLPANADLELQANPGNSSPYGVDAVIVPFHTGDALVQGPIGELTATIGTVTRFLDTGRIEATLSIVPAADPDGLSRVDVSDPFGEDVFAAVDLGEVQFESSLGGPADTVWCANIQQIDGRDDAYGDPVTVCAMPTVEKRDPNVSRRGCDTGSGEATLAGLIVAAFAVRRRRCSR
jgi:hypothetical protein